MKTANKNSVLVRYAIEMKNEFILDFASAVKATLQGAQTIRVDDPPKIAGRYTEFMLVAICFLILIYIVFFD